MEGGEGWRGRGREGERGMERKGERGREREGERGMEGAGGGEEAFTAALLHRCAGGRREADTGELQLVVEGNRVLNSKQCCASAEGRTVRWVSVETQSRVGLRPMGLAHDTATLGRADTAAADSLRDAGLTPVNSRRAELCSPIVFVALHYTGPTLLPE